MTHLKKIGSPPTIFGDVIHVLFLTAGCHGGNFKQFSLIAAFYANLKNASFYIFYVEGIHIPTYVVFL